MTLDEFSYVEQLEAQLKIAALLICQAGARIENSAGNKMAGEDAAQPFYDAAKDINNLLKTSPIAKVLEEFKNKD